MKGFFIPLEFGKLKLTQIEEKLLATYRYYTLLKNGYHHCALSNKKLAEMLYVNERSIKRAKKKLKDLGYIKTNGGTRVWYVGIGVEETETVDEEVDEEVDEVDEQVEEKVEEQVDETEMTETKPVEEQVNEVDEVEEQVNETEITENEKVDEVEETDNKTDNKKDIVMEKSKSNVERIIDTLGDFYKTPEKLKYFYDKQQKWVDKINQADYEELTISTYASQIKFVINTEFGYPEVAAIPNQNKKEVKSEEFESCFM